MGNLHLVHANSTFAHQMPHLEPTPSQPRTHTDAELKQWTVFVVPCFWLGAGEYSRPITQKERGKYDKAFAAYSAL